MSSTTMTALGMLAAAITAALGFPAAAVAAEVAAADPASVPEWAPAVVPLIVYAIKYLFANVVPDTLVKQIRDEYLPAVAVAVGVLGTSAATGTVDWSQGAVVGLAGVGLHQIYRQIMRRADGR